MPKMQLMKAPGHRVLIKPDAVETKSKGGIVLVQDERTARINTSTGTVISVGPTAWMAYDYYKPNGERNSLWQGWCKKGDRVYFAKYAGKWLEIDNEEYVMVNDQDIVLVIETNDED